MPCHVGMLASGDRAVLTQRPSEADKDRPNEVYQTEEPVLEEQDKFSGKRPSAGGRGNLNRLLAPTVMSSSVIESLYGFLVQLLGTITDFPVNICARLTSTPKMRLPWNDISGWHMRSNWSPIHHAPVKKF